MLSRLHPGPVCCIQAPYAAVVNWKHQGSNAALQDATDRTRDGCEQAPVRATGAQILGIARYWPPGILGFLCEIWLAIEWVMGWIFLDEG
jgi:hypothetical protein